MGLIIGLILGGVIGFFLGRTTSTPKRSPIGDRHTVDLSDLAGDVEEPPDLARFDLHVVGESHYQANLTQICGKKTSDGVSLLVQATLVPEDTNPYDDQAVRVDINGLIVGYLSRDNARVYRKRTGSSRVVGAVILGGWDRGGDDRGHFGVRIDRSTL